eukprot:325401-Pyramimonas_sp.AAC.1
MKWKKWEEAREAMRQREAKSEAQKATKALLVTVQFCARMQAVAHKVHTGACPQPPRRCWSPFSSVPECKQ